jgi:hypothetical protein
MQYVARGVAQYVSVFLEYALGDAAPASVFSLSKIVLLAPT